MLKRLFLGVVALILVAVAVIIAAWLRFDIPRQELQAKYGSEASQYIELRSGAVAHVRDEGNPDGDVLVLVHGSNASLHTWEPWVANLGDTYRVISLDMPAHGLTGATPEADYSVTAMAAFTREVVRKLGVEKFTLAGNSMGGAVALNYAVAYPEDLEGLILVCSSGIAREEAETSSGDAARSFSLVNMPVVSTALRWLTPRFIFEDGLRGVFVDQSVVTDEMVDRYIELNVMTGTRDATRARFGTPRVQVPPETVQSLEMPALVMWGDKDPLIPVSVGYRFDELLPNSTLVVYENVGHIPMEEVADVSANDVRAFMAANAASAAAPAAPVMPPLEATVTVEDDGSLTVEAAEDAAEGDVIEDAEEDVVEEAAE
ncbi:alpha/beta hydrolase [Pyruvatibacter sp. HU-CL02332]|uniref:alpha/beta fold hydrolase n=1 Tax=Pyruvatibacter sp. HU-CL02332 TaxID=3127650 RepID=UPI0031063733